MLLTLLMNQMLIRMLNATTLSDPRAQRTLLTITAALLEAQVRTLTLLAQAPSILELDL